MQLARPSQATAGALAGLGYVGFEFVSEATASDISSITTMNQMMS